MYQVDKGNGRTMVAPYCWRERACEIVLTLGRIWVRLGKTAVFGLERVAAALAALSAKSLPLRPALLGTQLRVTAQLHSANCLAINNGGE